jgi:hypothetical protein
VSSQQAADWIPSCVMASNRLLESLWHQSMMPCLALQISRNYRTLMHYTAQIELAADYEQRAQYWLDRYSAVRPSH